MRSPVTITDLFGPDGHVNWWQECDRALVVFVYGLAMVRLSSRRVFGSWGALDTIVAIVVGSSLSRVLTGTASVGGTLAATTLLMGLHWVLGKAVAHSDRASKLLEGSAKELARDGKLERAAMLRASISRNDIDEALRQSHIEHLADTRLVMIEPSGKITVLKAR